MVTRPVVVAVVCVGFFLILQALVPKAMALKKPSYVDQFMMEGHRTHKRKNYMVQRARDKEIMGSLDNGVAYDLEPFGPERNPEELSAFIEDYANMIRNDVILPDKSVETRTRKRGNIKVKKYNNQVIPDPPCGCNYNEYFEVFDGDTFPQVVTIRNCRTEGDSCTKPYVCKNNSYMLTVLKKKRSGSEISEDIELPDNLNMTWYSVQIPISVGCTCKAADVSVI